MKIHIVERPFMCREGQFREGKHDLCFGYAVLALKNQRIVRVYLGQNRKTYYEITWEKAVEHYRKYGRKAITMRGKKRVFIIPTSICDVKTVKFNNQCT